MTAGEGAAYVAGIGSGITVAVIANLVFDAGIVAGIVAGISLSMLGVVMDEYGGEEAEGT